MRNHLMASIATKNKSKDRSKNEQFHSRQQKTKDKHNFLPSHKENQDIKEQTVFQQNQLC